VTLNGVTVHFADRDVTALRDVSTTISAGEHIAVLGASGSGKTTLLRAILGAAAFSGAVSVDGGDPARRDDRLLIRRGTGMLRQGADLVPQLSAQLNAAMGCSHRFGPRDWMSVVAGRVPVSLRSRLVQLADRHEITECLPAPVRSLSGGQRQRVALVRAVLGEPALLIADEPTSGLDPVSSQRVVRELRSAARGTVIVTTHDLAVARDFPRVIGVRDGELVHDGEALSDADARDLYGDAEW
jgi:ABC-type multidrug transport system ATPase subunit